MTRSFGYGLGEGRQAGARKGWIGLPGWKSEVFERGGWGMQGEYDRDHGKSHEGRKDLEEFTAVISPKRAEKAIQREG